MIEEETELQMERTLLEGLREGKADAYEELVRSFGAEMRAVALRLIGEEAGADDAVQDAFLSAFRSLDGFEGRSRLGTWLHRITINAALMKLRTQKRRREAELDELVPSFTPGGAFPEPVRAWDEAADEPVMRRELEKRVRGFIDELPDKYRLPLLLRDIEGLSNQEVASVLDVTVNSAKLRVHRARQALRTLLAPHIAEMA